MVSPYEKISLKILGSTVESSPCEELLVITIDSELRFHKHAISLCSKANQKFSPLAKIAKYLTINQQKIILNSFITAQFSYDLLIWTCHSTTFNNKTNRIQDRPLRIIYNDYKSNSKELLEWDYPFTIHERNIQYLPVKSYKVVRLLKNSLSSVVINVFQFG